MVYRRYRKRWYVDARVGKGVPFIGGTGIVAGSGRRGNQKRALAKYVKRQVVKQEETKELVTQTKTSGLTHCTLYTLQLNSIPQGTAGNQRIGDSVFYCGFNIKAHITASVSNSLWRIYVVKVRESYPSTVGTLTSGIGSSQMFRNGSVDPDSYINTDNVTILCSKTLKADQQFSGETIVREMRMNCRMMKRFQFRTGQQSEGEYSNYYLVVLPFITTGSPAVGTTVAGGFNVSVEQVWKDA